MRPSPAGRGDQAGAAFGDAEDRRDAVLAEIGIVGLALQAALGLLLELELGGDGVERRAVLQPLLSSARLGVEPLFGFRRLPVGDDLGVHLVQRAVARRRDALDLVEDKAGACRR